MKASVDMKLRSFLICVGLSVFAALVMPGSKNADAIVYQGQCVNDDSCNCTGIVTIVYSWGYTCCVVPQCIAYQGVETKYECDTGLPNGLVEVCKKHVIVGPGGSCPGCEV